MHHVILVLAEAEGMCRLQVCKSQNTQSDDEIYITRNPVRVNLRHYLDTKTCMSKIVTG